MEIYDAGMSAFTDTLVSELATVVSRDLNGGTLSVSEADLFAGFDTRVETLPPARHVAAERPPVVDQWLDAAVAAAPEPFSALANALAAATSELPWLMAYTNLSPSPGLATFQPFYSYQLLAGPQFRGHEPPVLQGDMLLGFTLQQPGVLYPQHHHEPAEVYGVISGHLDWQVGSEWSRKGPGDLIVHRSHESHAMQSLDEPVLCWVAWPQNPDHHVYMPSLDPPEHSMAATVYEEEGN